MLLQSKMQHSPWLVKVHARRDLLFWEWIKQTKQSINCPSVRWLKHRKKCIETNKLRLVCLPWNIVIYRDNDSDSYGCCAKVALLLALCTSPLYYCFLSTFKKSKLEFKKHKLMSLDKTDSNKRMQSRN